MKNGVGYAFFFEKMRFLDQFILKKIKGDGVSTVEYFDDRILQFAKIFTAAAPWTGGLIE